MKFGAPKVDILEMPEEEAPKSGVGGDSSLDAAKDILEAVEGKDAAALDMALKRHYELCDMDEDDSEKE